MGGCENVGAPVAASANAYLPAAQPPLSLAVYRDRRDGTAVLSGCRTASPRPAAPDFTTSCVNSDSSHWGAGSHPGHRAGGTVLQNCRFPVAGPISLALSLHVRTGGLPSQ